ncbi:hypothetical protein EVAR_11527_1 [Eumeta japonica]|uniref:Gustatory receptor n=1 Tax=Eumeta variegata TaxID=151549 RepID=A0A4C1TYR8_EUMVA|nr:hypothetical protein EVAR_11527_1 [Eumeta japonica]
MEFGNIEFNNMKNRLKQLMNTFDPVLATEKLLGINRFTLEGHNVVAASSFSKFTSFSISTSVVLWFAIFRIFPLSILGTAFQFNLFRDLPMFVILAQYWFTCVFAISLHEKINIMTLNDIHHLDTILHVNFGDNFYRRARKESTIAFLVLLISHVILECGDIFSDGLLSFSGVSIMITHFFQDLEVVMFYKLISMLDARLKILNGLIGNIKKKEENSLTRTIIISQTADTSSAIDRATELNNLASLYFKIGEIFTSINDSSNFQILMTLLSAFASIIVVIWAALNNEFKETFSVNIIRIVMWCTRYVCVIIILSFTCEKLISTRNNTKVLVNDIIMDYDQPPQVRFQAKAFKELIDAYFLSISIYDMFFVDVTLIIKFISVCTTYLIVIIQVSHFV